MTPFEEKRDLFISAHENLATFFVIFDPTHPAVLIPVDLKKKSSVQFQYGKLLVLPTNPTITAEGIVCDLSFSGRNHPTFVPWSAVYCIHFQGKDGEQRGRMWQESIPEAVKNAPKPVEKPRVLQPNGTYSLDVYRNKKAARGPNGAA